MWQFWIILAGIFFIKVEYNELNLILGRRLRNLYKIRRKTKDADIIFITHNHYDHFDLTSINKVKNDNTLIVMPNTRIRELKEIDKSYAYKLLSHGIEYIIVSQIVNDKGSKCGMLILEYTDASVIDEFNVKQKLHKASQECAALLTLSKHSCGNAIGIFDK